MRSVAVTADIGPFVENKFECITGNWILGMLNIYKASAGAGKTHRLTGEYIKLLFGKPYAFKHILAVTFTNKATDEMKQRILEELYRLSTNGGGSGYLKEVMECTGKDQEWVCSKAREILISLLHDYTSFRVSTIDKFFQQVMRSFAKELGRMATYNVELDRDSVLMKAVDRMFSDLDLPQNRKLLEWLIEYSLESVDKGASWNVKGEILELGKQIFSEDFKLAKERCGDAAENLKIEGVAGFKQQLRGKIVSFEKELVGLCRIGLEQISGHSLEPSDFKGGKTRSPFNYFSKVVQWNGKGMIPVPTATLGKIHCNIDEWYSGKKCPAAIEGVYGELNETVGKILGHLDDGYSGYATACAVYSNLNVLGILNDIYERVMEYCREKNVILLSESTELLGKIIDGSDTPFVYEKIGARLDNFMLDEFQDTSSMQWRNFYPLLLNSLAAGNDNLIVGDEKQSIYRWRGSDWKILKEDLHKLFRKDELGGISLIENYRSGEEIREFNNDFFEFCAQAAQQVYGEEEGEKKTIVELYKGVRQQRPEDRGEKRSFVEVEFVDREDDFKENVLELLPRKIEQLLALGFSLSDMAVLVRKGSEGNIVAGKLLECGYDIISSDSLYVNSSKGVQKVINILRELENPQSASLAVLRKFQQIPDVGEIKEYSLYQLCERLIRSALLEEEQNEVAFLQAFLDIVLEFTAGNGTNVSQFLEWWDKSGSARTISAPEDMDAITITTIHKSKGLAYRVVIIPFLEEKLDHTPTLAPNLWCSMENMPVPVKYAKGLLDTEFAGEYRKERLYKFIDSINTVYVAFTRPKDGLVVFAPKMEDTGKEEKSISDILYRYYQAKKDEYGWDEKIVIGEQFCNKGKTGVICKKMLGNPFAHSVDSCRIATVAQGGTIGDGESIREHGIAMHYVFSLVDYKESVEAAVERACAEGVATCSREELLEIVRGKIDSVEEYRWFSNEYDVMNECSILTPEGEEKRPDRVLVKDGEAIVVDYKFGAYSPEDTVTERKYKKQVSRYMQLLTSMGYTNVKGYLWYLSADVVKSV